MADQMTCRTFDGFQGGSDQEGSRPGKPCCRWRASLCSRKLLHDWRKAWTCMDLRIESKRGPQTWSPQCSAR